MAKTYGILGRSVGIPISTAVTNTGPQQIIDPSVFRVERTTNDHASGIFETDYHVIGSGKQYPVHLKTHSRISENANDGLGKTFNRVELNTWLETTDDVTGEVTYNPVRIAFFVEHPGLEIPAVKDVDHLLNALSNLNIQDDVTIQWTGSAVRKFNDGDTDVLASPFTDTHTNDM